MTKRGRNRAEAHFGKVNQAITGQTGRDVAAKAILDNMARLKALRLAREATEPPRPTVVKKARGKSPKKSEEKTPALSDWLVGQQSGGRRI
jgi:hypothetical protein